MNGDASGKRDRIQVALARGGLAIWTALGLTLLVFALGIARPRPQPAATRPPSARPPATAAPTDSLVRGYTPGYRLRTGNEILLVFVGGSFCRANRLPGFQQAIENAKLRVRDQAVARGRQFRAVAVSLDWKPGEALAFLEGFGEFDEVSVGSNWVNDSAVRYVWRELPGDPTVPQVVVVERHVQVGRTVQVGSDRVLKRVLGSDRIFEWVRQGAPL